LYRALAILLTAALLSATAASSDKRDDYHLTDDGARSVYAQSPFAHGYRHGYEEGFHDADLEFHMGRHARALKTKDVPRTIGYEKTFGSKDRFRRGYEPGYLAGYADSHAGREFHTLAATDIATDHGKAFDEGFGSGFLGRYDSHSVNTECTNPKPGFCEGFRLGLALASVERHSLPEAQVASVSGR
jgi:hypothetical protein